MEIGVAGAAQHPTWHLAVVALGAIAVFVGINAKEHFEKHEYARVQHARLARGGPVYALALCSAGAAIIHAFVCPRHFEEAFAFGVFFATAAAVQGAWAAVAFVRPTRTLLTVGVAGNAAVILVWAISRTAGLPIGPDTWHPETISALDAIATLLEAGVVLGASVLLHAESKTVASSA